VHSSQLSAALVARPPSARLAAMAKTILVCGFGPGISSAVAEKFGAQGFSVGLVARNRERLDAGVKALAAKGVKAQAFAADLADPAAVVNVVEQARAALGPITAVHWNAYGGGAGDLLTADAAAIHGAIDIAVTGLLAVVRAALPDLRAQKGQSAVLVTNGGFGYSNPAVDKICVELSAMGLGLANAAKHKLVGMLAQKLGADGIYVAEVVVLSLVKGTAFDSGSATLEPSRVADKFWQLYSARSDVTVDLS
jgi:NAD(P)-dependent dehydrogenase (short-subunit alcohol dehydrogenase family)